MKEKIIEVSLQQFLRHGIRKMTVKKLIEPLGISTKTVYKYFSDKEELLKHCLVKHYSELAADFDKMNSDKASPVIAIFEIWYRAIKLDFGVNHVFYRDLNYYHPRLQDAVLSKYFKKNLSVLENLLDEGIEKGYFRKDILRELIPEVIGLLYSSITRTRQFKKYKLQPKALLQNTIEPYLLGICTEKGLREVHKNYSSITK